jgi:copper(I)-binding protein
MRPILALALAPAALAACNSEPAPPTVIVEHVVVNLPAVPGRPGAAYFRLRSNTDPAKLLNVTSPLVQRVELHESMAKDGMSRMAPVEATSFPGTGVLSFKPGGKHAMLYGIDPSVKAGGKIPITFTFDPAPAVTVEAKVEAAGDGHDMAH